MANKRKLTTAVTAVVTAAAILLGGTFAWTSISQQARNEAIVDINPGGRLHDDFNGTNKDVYVENFSSGSTGVDIFARIRLDQYFEVGQDAGINKENADRKVTKILGTDITDVETWVTYIPGDLSDTTKVQANTNWQWALGNGTDNLPYYMPTFNKNKDSLKADINGTYEGKTEGDIFHYDDYTQYKVGDSVTQDATYDWDEDTTEDYDTETRDRADPIDSADVLKEEETHTATPISTTATVITMAEWLALPEEEQTGNFWVYDEDGWAYWAQAIAPETTTGLLLDGITMSRVPDDNYYYGINVVGQFATSSDWEMFFAPTEDGGGGSMTPNAQELMKLITNITSTEDETTPQTLVLTPNNTANTIYAAIDEEINVVYDITENETLTPDLSSVKITYDVGDGTPTELTAEQYDYAYDTETETGTLTITDPALDGEYLTVTDSTGAVTGNVSIGSTANDTPDFVGDGTLTLRQDNADTEPVTVNTGIPVDFDATDLDPEGNQPDITDVTVTRSVYNEETTKWDPVPLEKDVQYTYTYDEGTTTGKLTILDTNLEGERLSVADKNNVVRGDVDVMSDSSEDLTGLVLEASPNPDAVGASAEINDDVEISYITDGLADGQNPDITEITVEKLPGEGETANTTLTPDADYTYADNVLTITNWDLEGEKLKVTDKNGVVSGYLYIDYADDGRLTLDCFGSDHSETVLNQAIPVNYDTSNLDTEADNYVEPDISFVKVSWTNENEEEVPLTQDSDYTYTYDSDTDTGSLTITNEAYINEFLDVYDKNDVVSGHVFVSAEDDQVLELTADGTNKVEIDSGESVKVFSNDETADMSAIKVTYWTDFTEDGTPIFTELSADMFSYDATTGKLTILDESLSDDYKVTDNNGNVSGYLSIYRDVEPTTLTISYAASGEYSEIVQRGYIMPGERLMLVASTSDGQNINNKDCTWNASCDENHPCSFTDGELVISDMGTGVDHPHLITVTCTYVDEEKNLTLYDEFHIIISDEELIFTTTVQAEENAQITTGAAYTLSTTVSTEPNGEIDLGDLEWEYSIVTADGGYDIDANAAAVEGDQFMAFKRGTYYISAYYTEYLLTAATPSAIAVTNGEEMSRYYVQIETANDEETDTSTYHNVTVGATDQAIDVLDRIDGVACGFDNLESTTDGITLAAYAVPDEENLEWRITVADTVTPGAYTLNYTINENEEEGILGQTGTIDLVIDAAG